MEFKAKNTYMYNVFTNVLLTAKSKVPLRTHQDDFDAQKVYSDLLNSFEQGIAARVNSEDLEEKIKDMRLDDKWAKTRTNFLDIWKLKIGDYENMCDTTVCRHDKECWLT